MRPPGPRVAAMLVAVLCASCATAGAAGDGAPPAERLRAALEALDREDYGTARQHLLALGTRCESGESGLHAVLLLAAAELDTNNPGGSADAAAALAAHYLLVPDAPEEQRPLARTIYRLAADRGGTAAGHSAALPALPLRYHGCAADVETGGAPPALPSVPMPTTAERMAALQAQLAARSDSLEAVKAELRRITELLRTGTPVPAGGPR